MATEWKKVRLGDIATVTSSKRVFANQYTKTGIPFYRQKEIIEKNRGEELSEQLFISNDLYRKMKMNYGVPQKNDLLITGVGVTLGIPYLVKDETFYFKDGNLIWLKDITENVNSQFIFYYINSAEGQKTIWARTIGSAQPALTIDLVKQFQFPCPPLETQQKIAGILSAYDDLIENNRKQIKLLEEAAQKLYKEWFVKLNFPGHENVKIVDGVPEEWKKVRAEDYFEVTIGKTPPRNETKWFSKGNIGKKWISIADMGNSGVFIFQTSENLTNEAIESKNVKIIPANTVLLSFKLTVGRVSITTEEMTTNEAIAHFVTDNKFIREYIYLYLKNFHYDYLGSTSAISTAINSKIVKSMPIIIPPESLLEIFSKLVAPYFDKIKSLQNQIQLLQSARDKLLPKLMNGDFKLDSETSSE